MYFFACKTSSWYNEGKKKAFVTPADSRRVGDQIPSVNQEAQDTREKSESRQAAGSSAGAVFTGREPIAVLITIGYMLEMSVESENPDYEQIYIWFLVEG